MNDKKINEGLRKESIIQDKRILDIINKCISELKSIGYHIDDDIDFVWGDSTHTFGEMFWPKYQTGYYTLALNKYMIDEPEDAIRNTVLHELAHYINMKDQLWNDIIFWYDSSTLKYRRAYYNKTKHSAHGTDWKRIAADISSKLHTQITRTNSFELHPGVGKHRDDKIKYIVKCKNCGNELKYSKKTAFVSNPNITYYDFLVNKYGLDVVERHYSPESLEDKKNTLYWSCGSCGAKGQWEVEEVNK